MKDSVVAPAVEGRDENSTSLAGVIFAQASPARGQPSMPQAVARGKDFVANLKGSVFAQAITAKSHPSMFHADGREKTPQEVVAELAERTANLATWKREVDADLSEHSRLLAAAHINGGGGEDATPVDREYSAAFANYTRRGASDAEHALRAANGEGERAAIQAAMTVGDNSSGGYIAPSEWDKRIQTAQRSVSPMRRLAAVVTSSQGAYATLWSDRQWGSGWVGETAARVGTSNPTLQPLQFPSGEIYAMPSATQRLLDDSAINVEQWIAGEVAGEFSAQESIAFIGGDGINKPRGFLTYVPGGASAGAHPGGNIGVSSSGLADGIPNSDVLIDLKYKLAAPYRQNSVWLMNSQTAATVAKLKDADGNYIWREGLLLDQPATLLGRPVEIDESMPNIAAGAMPIAYGDFARGYLINDRKGVRILRDPFTNKPFVMFYTTKRVGGGLLDPNAIRVLKISA